MPAVLREGPYRFFFYAADRGEPVHVHVVRDRQKAKFWLDPISLVRNKGFAEHELRRIREILSDHQHELIRGWHDYFGA